MKDLHSTCSDVRDKLPLFAGRDLDPIAVQVVRAHLGHCEGCAREAQRVEASRQALRTSLMLGVSTTAASHASLWDGVRAVLVAEGRIRSGVGAHELGRAGTGAPDPAAPTILRPRFRLLRRTAGLAAAAAVLFAALVVGPRLLSSEGPRADVVDGERTGPIAVTVGEVTPLGSIRPRDGEVMLAPTFGETLLERSAPWRMDVEPAATATGADSLASNTRQGPQLR